MKKVCGVGFTGNGIFNHLDRRLSNLWNQMLVRCYRPYPHQVNPYSDCTVCASWHDYQNFCSWVVKQPMWETWEIDKDWRVVGNKVYGPATCSYVPHEVNCLLGYGRKSHTRNGKWLILEPKTRRQLGRFDSELDAHNFWVSTTKERIKNLLLKYNDKLNEEVITNMASWNG